MNFSKNYFKFVVSVLLLGTFTSVFAHVKWFAPYDLKTPPLSLDNVVTPQFLYLYIVSILFIYAFFWLDRFLFRINFMSGFAQKVSLTKEQSLRIIRYACSIFFTGLFIYGIQGNVFLLTPELKTSSSFIPWLQLTLAATALFSATAPLTGLGMIILYAFGIMYYGIHHMLDYMIFVGIAIFLLLCRLTGSNWVKSRYIILFATTGLTLLWAAIEKWSYPYWTFPMLESNPGMLMGMSPAFYMMFAGFVEFNITFILLSSASIFSRFIALGLNSVFILAVYKFGLVDFIGHLLIITILLILTLSGPTNARYFLVLSNKSLWTESYFMTGLYILAFNIVFIAYYGIYYLAQ